MENRRTFFKALAAFTSGVVTAKLSSYVPKKEEPKEEVLVPSRLTITHEGEEYHPLVVKKTNEDKCKIGVVDPNTFCITGEKHTLRKAKI